MILLPNEYTAAGSLNTELKFDNVGVPSEIDKEGELLNGVTNNQITGAIKKDTITDKKI
jgi:hypothetical protein